jgi:Zn-dependent peptidase ImmA (M78 family)
MLKPNYNQVYIKVKEVIEFFKLDTIPINLNEIIDKTKNLRICSYSQFAQNKCTIQEVVDYFGSELGAYACTKDQSKCVIYYNDTKNNIGLDRFTIAHELGHHFLCHYKYMMNGTILLRGLSNPDYAAIEKEANCFARNLLSPVCLIYSIGIIPDDVDKIKDIFNITKSAATIRLKCYALDLDSQTHATHEFFDNQFKNPLKLLNNLNKCNTCKYYFFRNNEKYCPICGKDNMQNIFTEYGGIEPMIYSKIETNTSGKANVCPVCENEITNMGNYCPICGTYIVNKCTQCGKLLSGYARYCTDCGNETTFLQQDLLPTWNLTEQSDEITPFDINDLEF